MAASTAAAATLAESARAITRRAPAALDTLRRRPGQPPETCPHRRGGEHWPEGCENSGANRLRAVTPTMRVLFGCDELSHSPFLCGPRRHSKPTLAPSRRQVWVHCQRAYLYSLFTV